MSADEYRALPWGRGISVPGFAVWVFFYHFSLIYTGIKKQKAILLIAYILLALVVGLAPTGLLVERLRVEAYGYASVTGPIGLIFFLAGFILIILAVVNLAGCYRKSTSYEERNRLFYLSAAAVFPVIGGGLDGFSDLPPAAMWANLIFCIICSVAIIKYHLLDIKIVFRKGLVYLLISSIIAVPYVIILVISSRFLGAKIDSWWVYGLTILFLTAILRPIYDWAQQIIDRLFYRDRYDYLKALEQFSYQAQSVLNLEELGSKMVQLVSGAIRTRSACLLLQDEEKRGFIAAYCSGLSNKPSGVVIRNDSPIVKWLQSKCDILSIDRFDLVPQLQSISLRERKNIERMGATLFVPIGADQKQLSGIIVLGEKLSQQSYSWEDKRLLSTVSNQMFMAVENAKLYEQTKQSETVLRESEEKLRLMYESMMEGVIVTNLEGRISQVNESAVHMHGYEAKDQLIQRNITELIDVADRKKVENNIKAALRGEKTKSVEITFLTYKAGEFPGELNISLLRDTEGKPAGFVMVSEDITESKLAEEREKRLQAELNLSSRLASVGELAAGVAHEINNPLTSIMGFSQRLLRKSTDATSKRDLERIFSETQRAARVVENLRTFAKRSEPKKEKINIHEVLNKSIEMRAYELKTSNIEIVTNLASEIPPVVVDFHQIQQVFLNIIMNAEQAMSEAKRGGKLNIWTKEIGHLIQISFTDDGPGISKKYHDKIFDPFFTTRSGKGGTGLGLSICHGIITDHGGNIYVKSALGKGTTVFVELGASLDTDSERTNTLDVTEMPRT
jgi:PAS domain S-box-containing protein